MDNPPDQPAPEFVSQGNCRLCGSTFGKAQMTNHLTACLKAHAAAPGDKSGVPGFHLVVDGGRYAPDYWLHLVAPATATFGALDGVLRDIWLECCEHMSAFRFPRPRLKRGGPRDFNALRANLQAAEDGLAADEQLMDKPLGAKLRSRMTFMHEYDFGSTTTLALRVVAEPTLARTGNKRSGIRLLARNEPPPIPCHACGQPAAAVCTQCVYEGTGWLCKTCVRQHECGDDMCLPVVNSPRVGVCGYSGPSREP